MAATIPTEDLPKHTLRHADGRALHLYGEVRGRLPDEPGPGGPPPGLHLRRDALSGAWLAVSPARNTRPQSAPSVDAPRPGCPLCPGGPEVPFSYDAAVFENRFPSLLARPPEPPTELGDGPAEVAASTGRCEVVLYTEEHSGSLATLSPAQLARVVAVWRDRSDALWADPRHAYVLAFENRGEAVGATLSHPHGQIYAFDHLPPVIAARDARLRDHRAAQGTCLSCEVIAADDRSDRVVVANDSLVVAVPFAPRWPYEVHVRARRHGAGRLGDLAPAELRHLAAALRDVVQRYERLYAFELPYMMVAHETPHDQPDWHLSFEFFPPHRGPDKLKLRASVETATGMFINDTLPESSAHELAHVAVPATDWTDVPVAVVTDG